jgi:predicted DNA binding CopG/RHH family protein
MNNLTKEELEIIDYIENKNAKSIPNVKDEISRYTKLAKEHCDKKKAISLRLLESDLYLLKQKALQKGLNYQNIIQSLVHQYLHGQIEVKL